jgi:outer membrane protein
MDCFHDFVFHAKPSSLLRCIHALRRRRESRRPQNEGWWRRWLRETINTCCVSLSIVHVKNGKRYSASEADVLGTGAMSGYLLVFTIITILATSSASAAGLDDPFSTRNMLSPSPADRQICQQQPKGKALALVDVVEFTLCNNPQTRASWAAARAQAAQYGASESAWLPSLTIQGSGGHDATRTSGVSTVSNLASASVSVSYLLYNFGGRHAGIESARELMIAANASANATVQNLFLNAVKAYFGVLSAAASVKARIASVESARESMLAAEAQVTAGTATPADELQAKTAYAQAVFNRVQAQGNARISRGVLANVMGLRPTEAPSLQPVAEQKPNLAMEKDIDHLIDLALARRPDLEAANAQIKAAKANITSARASGLPSLTLDGSISNSDTMLAGDSTFNTRDGAISINLSFPLFTGFDTTYKVLAAEAQLEDSTETRRQLANQVTLDVWQAYQELRTQGEALISADTLLASAKLSNDLNLGRYKAGVGTIVEVLSSQSALASARQQHVSALYNWNIARFSLAQAIGMLDLTALTRPGLMEH